MMSSDSLTFVASGGCEGRDGIDLGRNLVDGRRDLGDLRRVLDCCDLQETGKIRMIDPSAALTVAAAVLPGVTAELFTTALTVARSDWTTVIALETIGSMTGSVKVRTVRTTGATYVMTLCTDCAKVGSLPIKDLNSASILLKKLMLPPVVGKAFDVRICGTTFPLLTKRP
jgi:hypothetical protein